MDLEKVVEELAEDVPGPLLDALPQFIPESIWSAARINRARWANEEMRYRLYITSDSASYGVEDGEAMLYFGGIETHFIFKNPDVACEELRTRGYSSLRPGDNRTLFDSVERGRTKKFRVDDLIQIRLSGEDGGFEIDTENYETTLTSTQRAFTELIFDDFKENMRQLRALGKKKIMVVLLNSEYIISHAKPGSYISMLCWQNDLDPGSTFSAAGAYVKDEEAYIRGVKKPEYRDQPR